MSDNKGVDDTTKDTIIAMLEEKNEKLAKQVKELTERVVRLEEWAKSEAAPGRRQPF